MSQRRRCTTLRRRQRKPPIPVPDSETQSAAAPGDQQSGLVRRLKRFAPRLLKVVVKKAVYIAVYPPSWLAPMTKLLKRLLPGPVKNAIKRTIRWGSWGQPLRPSGALQQGPTTREQPSGALQQGPTTREQPSGALQQKEEDTGVLPPLPRLRIAVWHNLASGGGKRALYNHVKGLIERGHVVEVWCPPSADQSYLPLRDLVPEHIVPLSVGQHTPKNRVDRMIAPYRDIINQLDAMGRHCQACAREINSGGFDILFANSCALFRVPQIGRYVDIPSVLYLQEPYRALYEASPRLPWLALPPMGKAWWRRENLMLFMRDLIRLQGLRVQAREELEGAKAFDAILCNSYFSRESILRAYGLDAKVCYLGIDTSIFKTRHRKRGHLSLGLGRSGLGKTLSSLFER